MLKILITAAVIGAFAFAVSVVGLSAWRSFYKQQHQTNQEAGAEEATKNGGESAPNVSPKESAEQAIARYNLWLMIFTGVLAFVSLIQIGFLINADRIASESARAAQKAAVAAQKAATVAEKTLIASNRAWISIDRIWISSPLTISENGADTTVAFEIMNIGQSPASNVTPHAWLGVMKQGGPFPMEDQERRCAEIRKQPLWGGFTLFPQKRFPASAGYGAYSAGVNISGDEIKKGLAVTKEGNVVLFVVGCIDYSFAADPGQHHQTGFIYD